MTADTARPPCLLRACHSRCKRAVASLVGGRRYPMLFDSRLRKSIEREARAHYAGPEAAPLLSALAILIGSPATRAMGNFFLTLNKPQVPTRLSTDEIEALAWLRGFAPDTR